MTERTPSPRERARAVALDELKAAARAQLAERGAAALSVREVARAVGMSSSGVYRYFASRDELLTALIIDAYDALGAAAEAAEGRVARADLTGRWQAVCDAVRTWALASPQEYGLLYGSPVPGYAAPPDTIGPAARVAFMLADILRDAWASGAVPSIPDPPAGAIDPSLADAASPLRALPTGVVAAGLSAWAAVFGLVSFELFGHFVGSVGDRDVFFSFATARLATTLGLDTAGS